METIIQEIMEIGQLITEMVAGILAPIMEEEDQTIIQIQMEEETEEEITLRKLMKEKYTKRKTLISKMSD